MPLPVESSPLHAYFMGVSFVFGLIVGSFCNVCICRWPAGLSVVKPRSRCPKCMHEIAWFDNIPVVSWLILRARCRHCGLPIPWRYPAIEMLTGLLFLAVFARFGMTAASPVYMLLTAAMVIVTVQDLDDWTIPDEITLPGIPAGLALSLVGMFMGPGLGLRVNDPIDALLGIALGGGILYALDIITVMVLKKPGMGFGDVKLLAMLGAFAGWKGALGTIVIASVGGSLIGGGMILWRKLRGVPEPAGPTFEAEGSQEELTLEGHYLPFGPCLAAGGILYLFFGPELLAAYQQWLLGPGIAPY